MKKALLIVLIAAFFLLSVGLGKNLLIRTAINGIGPLVLGAPMTLKGFSLGVLTQSVRLKGLVVYNPKGFPSGTLINIPLIRVDYDLSRLLKKQIHIPNLTLELKEIVLVKNKNGALNVESLKITQERHKEEKPAKAMPFRIDIAHLAMGKLVYKDYSGGAEPDVRVYEINLKKTYKNITSPQQLALLILTEPMKTAGIKGAAIYGLSVLSGAALLPVAAGVTLAGKDSALAEFKETPGRVYEAALKVLGMMGKVTRQNAQAGTIGAGIGGASVAAKIEKTGTGTKVTVSARKYLLPKPDIAGGVLYRLTEELK